MIVMDTFMGVSDGHIGWLVWLVWLLMGVFEALFASRLSRNRTLWADITVGAVASLLGGFFSIQFLGDTPVMRFLISLLGAVFFATACLLLLGYMLRPRR